MKIDSHHHFWRYDPIEYSWIDERMSVIRRDFLPPDLKAEIDLVGIGGVVSVQARQSLVETKWLLELAAANDFIKGVVGWVPLVSPSIADILVSFSTEKKLKAVRHVLQGEPAEYMLRDDFNNGIGQLKTFGLVYDILIFENQLSHAMEFVDRHPEQVFVIDHIAKPRIKENVLSPWREHMLELGKRHNVYCKLSGMTTEADYTAWTPQQLQPYFDAVLEAFGPRRLMFGTDWPVCLVAVEYGHWNSTVKDFASRLTPAEQERILGGTATEAYRL